MNSGRVKDVFLLKNLREQRYLCSKYEFEIRAFHVPGVENRMADALSRWSISDVYRKRL